MARRSLTWESAVMGAASHAFREIGRRLIAGDLGKSAMATLAASLAERFRRELPREGRKELLRVFVAEFAKAARIEVEFPRRERRVRWIDAGAKQVR